MTEFTSPTGSYRLIILILAAILSGRISAVQRADWIAAARSVHFQIQLRPVIDHPLSPAHEAVLLDSAIRQQEVNTQLATLVEIEQQLAPEQQKKLRVAVQSASYETVGLWVKLVRFQFIARAIIGWQPQNLPARNMPRAIRP